MSTIGYTDLSPFTNVPRDNKKNYDWPLMLFGAVLFVVGFTLGALIL